MNTFGRVAVCGAISQYNATEQPKGYWLINFIINQLQFLLHRPLCVSADPWSSTEGGGVPDGKVAGGVAKGIQTNERLDFRGNYHTKRKTSTYIYVKSQK